MKKNISFIFLFCLIHCTLFAKEDWDAFKAETILKMSGIHGWCSDEKALVMMDVINKNKCRYCIEIGVFSGKSLLPIARTVQYNESGVVYAIDAWDRAAAIKGLIPSNPNYGWWKQIDFDHLYHETKNIMNQNGLIPYCHFMKNLSQDVVSLFGDGTIDFIHFDGNHNEKSIFSDVTSYYPKIKNGGFIVLNDPNWLSSKEALVFLLERTDLISSFSPTATFYIFRKNKKRQEAANALFKN